MATLLLSAAGAAFGAGFGGTVLGLSGAVIGRAIGATMGRVIDQKILGGGADAVEVGRIDRLRLMSAGEGKAIAKLWGRMRLAGHVIWASQYEEHSRSRRGGKGAPSGPSVTEYSYTVSLAIGLCEGEILRVGRIWADGTEIEPRSLSLRVYHGTEDQLPDPRIEAIEGEGEVPAFRGLAYVVIEDLDVTAYGNRVPQFSFEVVRSAQGPHVAPEDTLSGLVSAVAIIPGTGEYALATTPVHISYGPGENVAVNSTSPSGLTDFRTGLDQLSGELPNCGSVSLVVSWFGSDLRCGRCEIRPKVEQRNHDGQGMAWHAGGVTRATAGEVPRRDSGPVYGGTPADASVIEAIRAIRADGKEVMFYPFILMEQQPENGLPDPWSGAADQPVMPWRGRITTDQAPGRQGSTDRTAQADDEVAAFFGAAQPAHFSAAGSHILYSGPEEWRYRRFILHYAHLCALAGGVDAFCIGSEMRSLTQIRNGADAFPAVAGLMQLAAEVRAILGPAVKISYAADWTEYGSYVADGNLYFPLDDLWAHPAVDFIGIDNYMPLSDWRDGEDHADAAWSAVWNPDYLKANIEGGEGFDWYYDSPEGEAAQVRLPITDGAFEEPWVFRVKDMRNWWQMPHHSRTSGVRSTTPTAWEPQSKPILFTEYGCAAVDKGTNQPNKFLDLMSSESALPRASNGARDDLIQMQYLRAMNSYWRDPEMNPQSSRYDGRMIDMSRAHVWAWDARPFPEFPGRVDKWTDGPAYLRGHWLNGRATGQPLAAVIREICGSHGIAMAETATAQAVVRGYLVDQVQSGRASLQPLLQTFGVDAYDLDGKLVFQRRLPGIDHRLASELYAVDELEGQAEVTRAPEVETGESIRLGFIDAEAGYEARMAETRHPADRLHRVAGTEVSLAMTSAEGLGVTRRWLAESRIARDGLRLSLSLSRMDVGPGDRIATQDGSVWRVERVEQTEQRRIEAVRIEGGIYEVRDEGGVPPALAPFVSPVPVWPVFLDLPLLRGDEEPHRPYIAVGARPWPGSVALWSQTAVGGFTLNRLVTAPSVIGRTETELLAARPGVWDRGEPLRIRLSTGVLSAANPVAVLNGANVMAIGDGSAGNWEVIQFAGAELVAPRTWEVTLRLRGQAGTDGVMPAAWPVGSTVVLLDGVPAQMELSMDARGLSRRYRIGVSGRGYDDPNVVEIATAFDGIGLRPMPVSHLRGTARAGQDLSLSWIRRTRIGGDSWQQTEVPLSEESEGYMVRILVADVIRREVTTSAPHYAYPLAQQVQDGAQSGFTAMIAQLSPSFGAGPFRSLAVAP
ncbi:glycoside hydrolase/phage tail family protein [Paracoccus sp. IB05]|uniref:baseplate multidomain protein megatron n=1 Tax=Paracoccus sp. IB05 TaxID=2779367 RepID=UPI0018E7E9FD|nr:glycoside hydrolase/phage tail family protein [Paracoccus sp. IB05]MBJ2150909.1 glycoside hydrolase/phage tail family protein [Paracoccus sp. IB05]